MHQALQDLMFLPPWQVLLTVAGVAYLFQQKWAWSRRLLLAVGVGECSFCFGAHLGSVAYVLAIFLRHAFDPISSIPLDPWPTFGFHVLSFALWVFGSAASSLLLDKVTE